MNYLFFDIECCDGMHICEFGYVLIDEQFNIINRECITINPEYKFNLTGRDNAIDISLSFPESIYFDSPVFPDEYERIKNIIQMKNCRIICFSGHYDSKFLSTACDLYNLEPIKYSYTDFQQLYQAYTKSENITSIKKIVEALSIEGITLHKSDDDSYAVMKALQCIAKKENLNINATLAYLKRLKKDYNETKLLEHFEKCSSGNKNHQERFLKNFMKRLKVNQFNAEIILKDKLISISQSYQINEFNKFLNLISAIYNIGGTYTTKVSECDIFVNCSKDNEEDVQLINAKNAVEEGKTITILSLEEFLLYTNITEKDLTKINYLKKEKTQLLYTSGKVGGTIGDQLKAKGIDLTKLFS